VTSGQAEGSAASDVGRLVAQTADAAELHAPVPTLLMELQTLLGTLCAAVANTTHRGRKPFRPDDEWPRRLGDLGYGMYLLADQTGVDLASAISATANNVGARTTPTPSADPDAWPFEAH